MVPIIRLRKTKSTVGVNQLYIVVSTDSDMSNMDLLALCSCSERKKKDG